MKQNHFAVIWIAVFLLLLPQQGGAETDSLYGMWQYQEIVQTDSESHNAAQQQGVLLGDLDAMPLDLLGKVFGKLHYTLEFTQEQRFLIQIRVMGLRFTAQGSWSVEDDQITLLYDAITGFEKLRWLGGFDHLTHCDKEHIMTETVQFSLMESSLVFYSSGANLIFAR